MNSAIIAAAGCGSRMVSDQPKQFLLLAGVPIIFHTLRAFERCASIDETIIVLPPQSLSEFIERAAKFGLKKISHVVAGGATRAESVKRGLSAVRPATSEIVAVHDGVRPFVSVEEISRTVDAAKKHDAAILVAPVVDTIKKVHERSIVTTLDRRNLRRSLTPQCFRYELLMRAYAHADLSDPGLTDDSLLVEQLGVKVAIVEGSSSNIKITTHEDLRVAEALIRDLGT